MNLLQTAIDSLWVWTYGIIVGWGASFTIMVAAVIFLLIKIVRLNKRIYSLENRVICNEREMNFHISGTENK